MNVAPFWEVLLTLAHFVGVGGVAMRVIWVRRPAGSAFAWLLLVALVPYVGVVAYLLFGERPIGRKRLRRAHAFYAALPQVATPLWQADVAEVRTLPPPLCGIATLAENAAGMPVLGGSTLVLHDGAEGILRTDLHAGLRVGRTHGVDLGRPRLMHDARPQRHRQPLQRQRQRVVQHLRAQAAAHHQQPQRPAAAGKALGRRRQQRDRLAHRVAGDQRARGAPRVVAVEAEGDRIGHPQQRLVAQQQ